LLRHGEALIMANTNGDRPPTPDDWQLNGIEVDRNIDAFGTYETYWACTPPATGASFRVIRETWTADFSRRTILEYELVE